MSEPILVPVKNIKVVSNVRKEIGDLTELMDSIKQVGLLQPIGVSKKGKGYTLEFGNRRLAAYKELGEKKIPVIVVKAGKKKTDRVVKQVIENMQRTDMTGIDEARAIRDLMENTGWTQEKVAKALGLSKFVVNKRLALLKKLPEDVQEAVRDRKISLSHAKAIASADLEPTEQIALLGVAKELSGNEFEAFVKEGTSSGGFPQASGKIQYEEIERPRLCKFSDFKKRLKALDKEKREHEKGIARLTKKLEKEKSKKRKVDQEKISEFRKEINQSKRELEVLSRIEEWAEGCFIMKMVKRPIQENKSDNEKTKPRKNRVEEKAPAKKKKASKGAGDGKASRTKKTSSKKQSTKRASASGKGNSKKTTKRSGKKLGLKKSKK